MLWRELKRTIPDESVVFNISGVNTLNIGVSILRGIYLIKFSWVTLPVVKYLIPYTDTIPMFSIARNKF